MSFIKELKQRSVFRVGIAYADCGLVDLLQASRASSLDSFAAHQTGCFKTVLFLLVVGFPLALVLAWGL